MYFVLLGALRPGRVLKGDNSVRLRPSHPTARSLRRRSDKRAAQLPQWRYLRVGSRLLPEGVVRQIQLARLKQRPWNAVPCEESGKAISLEGRAFEHAIVDINFLD